MRRILGLTICLAMTACGGSEPSNNPSPDLAPASSSDAGGGKAFGASCTMDGECATGHCFIGMSSFCTMPCTAATQATDCPAPPTSGTCNMRGFCKP